MKHVSIIEIIFTIGLLVFLNIFQDSIPRISEPISNTLFLIGVVIFAMIYGMSKINTEHHSE